MSILLGMTAFATPISTQSDIPGVNTIFTNEEGEKEIVIRVEEDGSFVTSLLSQERAVNPNQCQHTNLEMYGKPKGTTQSHNKQDPDNCYKTRTVQEARCLTCNRTGLKVYSSWEEHPHNYPLFSNKCKKCGYTK